MRNAMIGSFLGMLLAVGVLVACGGGGGNTPNGNGNLEARLAFLENLLAEVGKNDDGDLVIEGINVCIVNGMGATETVNGKGNVIIGYQELRGVGNDRSGSHMLVVGMENNYSTYGGIVVGQACATHGIWSAVCGGEFNTASGRSSQVSGGAINEASGDFSQVSAGNSNRAIGDDSQVSGGNNNTAGHTRSQVSGKSNQTTAANDQVLP